MKRIFMYFCFTLLAIGIFFVNKDIVNVNANVYPFNGVIVADSLILHSEPNYSNATATTQVAYGSRVKVLGESGSMYLIEFDNGQQGYGAKSLILNVDANTTSNDIPGIETYTDYCNMLKGKNFPESYCPYLYYVHSKHPTWVFEADVIGKSLEEVSLAEQGKNVLQTGNPNYWYSYTPIEGDYYYVKSNVIASFMDPRNSLFERYMFQFLNLEKNTDVYNEAAMTAITGFNGNLVNQINYYAQAGVNEGVNPIHMLTRSSQEGMNKKTYGSVSGTYSTDYGKYTPEGYSLNGYYNYFNVGAYATEGYTTVGRGLAYAAGFLENSACISTELAEDGVTVVRHYYDETKCPALSDQRPWNTPEKAILGGSKFLAQKYVKKGQNTLFYQKFNIGTKSQFDIYTHQYMTNIYAPVSESSTMYSAYQTGQLLESSFEFLIPVYTNMSEVYQPVDKNSETRLSEIKVNNELITGYDKDVVEYEVNVITSEDKVNVSATAMEATTTVSGTGDYTFVNDQVIVELNTVAEDGSLLKYVITIKRVLPENKVTVEEIVAKMAVKVNGNIMFGISPGTNASTMVNTVVTNKGTAKVYDAAGNLKANGALATGDKIVINGSSDASTYYIAVRGDTSGDGVVKINDLILVQSHILGTRSLTDVRLYAGDVNYDGAVKINDLILVQSHILGKGNL